MLNMFFGASPSGKAAVFGAAIRRFDPFRPSQNKKDQVLNLVLFHDINIQSNRQTQIPLLILVLPEALHRKYHLAKAYS